MRGRTGAVLLEVMLSLAILALAGASLLALSSSSNDAVTRGLREDRRMREANAFMAAVSLWTRDDLDRRLGERAQGPWTLVIHREARGLYEAALIDSTTRREIIRTMLFRHAEQP